MQMNEARSSVPRLRETAFTIAAALVVVLFCGVLLVWDPGFFWIDDMQSGALPGYAEMARAWRSGEVPLLNRTSWHAGAIAGEFPAGAFSPSLALSILLVFGLDFPLPLAAAGLSMIHLAILAAGAFRLARQRGLTCDLALLVTLVASLNGWIIYWGARNWGVCLFSFAWVPWVWWGLEYGRQARHGRLRFVPAGLFLFLLITAGWPHTILMAAVLSAWIVVQSWAATRRLLDAWPTPAAWAVGLGLSAPAWMMFLEYAPNAARVQASAGLRTIAWSVPFEALPGLILPNVTTLWYVFDTIKLHVSTELAGGLVPMVVLGACLWFGGRACIRSLRWEWGLFALVFVLATSPSIGNFRYSFRWLPLFFLTLGLLAAQSLAWLRGQDGQAVPSGIPTEGQRKLPNLGRIALYVILCIWIRATLSQPDANGMLMAGALGLLALAFLWWQIEERYPLMSRLRSLMPAVVVFVSCALACVTCAPGTEVPTWRISEHIRAPGPIDPQVRYLSIHTLKDIFILDDTRFHERLEGIGAELYFGNTPAYAGLDFINGYSPMLPLGMHQLFCWEPHGGFYDEPEGLPALSGSTVGLIGSTGGAVPLLAASVLYPGRIATNAERVLVSETGPRGLLQLMGVDGLVVSDRFEGHRATLLANGWRETGQVHGGRVFRRNGAASPRVRVLAAADWTADRFDAGRQLTSHGGNPVPSVLLDPNPANPPRQQRFAPAQVHLVEDGRNGAAADVTSPPGEGEILVVFSRPWFPGYQARCNGQAVPVEVFDLILPAVRLPAGTNGRIELEYRPGSYVLGCRLAGATALGLFGAVLVAAWQRRRRPSCPSARLTGWFACYASPLEARQDARKKEVTS